ncbi:unnamed protein product [Angiostrongylus costaricensis]|uniref:Late endosomal/lysosomal adaptor and MAPK and MTOR activator 1 n=1 Tax=Angiostrongylus costaricensis TaxID=334426 RepID=A0A0R3PP87_ANGCS|nr:unnamed protein product [Angiostrongylus costaricensis]
MRTNNSHPLAANISGYDDENGGNVTYVAAGTAPVSSTSDDLPPSSAQELYSQKGTIPILLTDGKVVETQEMAQKDKMSFV